MEFMIVLTAYTLLISSVLTMQNNHNDRLKKKLDKIKAYKKISRTSGACSYKYFHGTAVELPGNYVSPTEASNNTLTLKERGVESTSNSFSPHITPQEGKLTCTSTRAWYLEKAK